MSILRTSTDSNPISLNRTLTDLGYELAPMKRRSWAHRMVDGPDAAMTREMLAVLDLPGKEAFAREQAKPITDWVTAARENKEF